ncbi:TetR/AcrR family transcriptional regulator [Microbacterium suwonense]|nr:TetR/AcrR family transcriptional regulator [Microbacterium suwonense]
MPTVPSESPRRRRHGKQLEEALLTSAWEELVQAGYGRLTMESVARRAHTSEPVLYRRWANKDELVLAAAEHYRAVNPVEIPDTGALRSDLIAYMTASSQARATFFAVAAAAAFSGLLADTGLTPTQIRERVMSAEPLPSSQEIYRRAHDRGELDLHHIPDSVLEMPFELVRYNLLMDLKPLGSSRIRSIVDELFLPLLELHRK